MQLSTKARYAMRAMVDLARHYGEGPVKLRDIAERQEISLKYLEQVMLPLRIKGYVKTLKGSKGGYVLSRPPEKITILDIVQSVEGSVSPVECAGNPGRCDRACRCASHRVWVGLREAIVEQLKKQTLAALSEEQRLLDIE